MTTDKAQADILLRGGLIVDGTGRPASVGNLLIRAGRIHRISPRPIRTTGISIDCAGKVVAPGFIDAHSPMDRRIPAKGHEDLKWPLVAQGITTVVAGHCGTSAAGYREDTIYRTQIEDRLLRSPFVKAEWANVSDLFAALASMGTSHNLALLAGHGVARASIRGLDPSPLHPYESVELLRLLERAMEQGARGASLGLQSEPGAYARPEELREVALTVKRRRKVLSVHLRALSALSGAYPRKAFGRPHNLLALEEALDLGRKTGVRLQISHLLFVGTRTWRTAEEALRLIDQAVSQGVDVRFDVHPYECVACPVGALLPPWFLARLPGAWEEQPSVRRLRRELSALERSLGFGAADVVLADARDPDLKRWDGSTLAEIGRVRRMRPEDFFLELAQKSGGRASVVCHRASSAAVVEELLRHPCALLMTGALAERSGVQNPAAFGAFPRFLRLAREKRLLSLEDAVRKMSGATAERFGITDRGTLAEGKAADITVLDWEATRETEDPDCPAGAPSGIEYVFINGRKIMSAGKKESPLHAGVPLPG
jgi:N-acyl-D-amino-acid deacylase